jgi:L-amino acid N-acyltransferase YncA
MIDVRTMAETDLPACTDILNHIIMLGGSTAHEEQLSTDDFRTEYFHDPDIRNVALSQDRVVGFQAAFDRGEGVFSIGSFTDRQAPVSGAGRALFAKTLADCRARGGVAILAKITADNSGGLAYYDRMGFADWKTIPCDHTRRNGTQVDRIVKRLLL